MDSITVLDSDVLSELGIAPGAIDVVAVLRQSSGHGVYRVMMGGRPGVLKLFSGAGASEPQAYALLERLGVPTLPVHARSGRAVLLEDLESSPAWRAASDADMSAAATGAAVAEWYHTLHRAGADLLREPPQAGYVPRPWVDVITVPALAAAGQKLELAGEPALDRALEVVDRLVAAYHAQTQTLSYNDFAGENLALSRRPPVRAIVFDYDCLTAGAVYSDWRNVMGSLTGAAADAFAAVFGPTSEVEQRLDAALCVLEGLVEAAGRPRFPAWAAPLVTAVRDGQLDRALDAALEVA